LLNNCYFQRKYEENTYFPLVIRVFLLYFQRILINIHKTMIIGREKEQRELLSLLEKEESQFCAVYGRRRAGGVMSGAIALPRHSSR